MNASENKPVNTCVSCGETVNGKFCSHCGEKVPHAHDKSIGHFFEELLHGFTHADGKFLRSLKFLFTRPGFLTSEYIAGRKKPYTSPISLFLIANLLYLLVPTTDALNSHYTAQTKGQPYSNSAQVVATKKMQERNWTNVQMEEHYNIKTDKVSKIMLILIVMLFSVPVMLFFYKKKYYYADHLAFATETLNFIILGLFLLLPSMLYVVFLMLWKVFHLNPNFHVNTTGLMLALALLFLQLYVAGKRVYKQPWYAIAPKALLLTASFICCVWLYRYILFYVVMMLL